MPLVTIMQVPVYSFSNYCTSIQLRNGIEYIMEGDSRTFSRINMLLHNVRFESTQVCIVVKSNILIIHLIKQRN